MPLQLELSAEPRRYAICVGVGYYTELVNHNLRYAVSDAQALADRLQDPQRGDFDVTLLVEPAQTTRKALLEALDQALHGSHLCPQDIVLIYLSGHGGVYGTSHTFYFMPSDAKEEDGHLKRMSVIDTYDFAKVLSGARAKNIILLVDACYSGGVGVTLEKINFDLDLGSDTNIFIIGGARHDQITFQSSAMQHGIFTNYLLQAFELKPNRSDGWLTITEIQNFIDEKVKSFDESKFIQIQAKTASVNSNLFFTKNPSYSPQTLRFYDAVNRLLQLVQYEAIETEKQEDAPPGFYIAEVKCGVRTVRTGIIAYYNRIEIFTLKEAERVLSFLQKQFEQGNIDESLIVTDVEVGREVKEIFTSKREFHIEVRTYEDISKNLIDFKRYLRELVYTYETPTTGRENFPLAQVYVPLHAEARQYRASVISWEREDKKHDMTITWQGSLEGKVRDWLSSSSEPRLALLADYGSGKSTFCRHIAAVLAKEYVGARKYGSYNCRVPLFISLLDFAHASVDLESYLVAYLKRICKVDNPDFDALIKMAEAGLLFFIFDGFDEMASRATFDVIRQNIAHFEMLANLPQNKVLITSRLEYFIDQAQEQQVLRSYSLLYLQPFNEEQVDFYLQKRIPFIELDQEVPKKDWIYYRRQINNVRGLSNLVYRPVLLEMILRTLPTLVTKGQVINRPNLYQFYLEEELDRQVIDKKRRDLLIDKQKRFKIMGQIALEMYLNDLGDMDKNRILELARPFFASEQIFTIEGSLRELLACSFLIRSGDIYRFSHQSFVEYLVASHLIEDISAERFGNFRDKLISPTILEFMSELSKNNSQISIPDSGSGYDGKRLDSKKLVVWFQNHVGEGHTLANIFSLLVQLLQSQELRELNLREMDLSGAILNGVDLVELDLGGTDLSGANLSDANLRGANLRGANLSDTDLGNADLAGVNLTSADLSYADLTGVDLTGAILSGTSLRGADLKNLDLSGLQFRDVDLEGAELDYADLMLLDLSGICLRDASLEGANLSLANLSYADLSNSDLSEADLRGANLSNANLSNLRLRDVNWSGMNLDGANLNDTDFTNANLRDADLSGADLSGADLSYAILRGANLGNATLDRANFRGADLSYSYLEKISIDNANLQGADLSNVYLDKEAFWRDKHKGQMTLWGEVL